VFAVYIGEEPPDEPDFQYIPDTHQISSTLPPGGDPLDGSIMLLTEGLHSGAAIAQFEQLYRKKTGLTMNAARLSENIPRNRYKDISPCKCGAQLSLPSPFNLPVLNYSHTCHYQVKEICLRSGKFL
jgi:hypothetical protein